MFDMKTERNFDHVKCPCSDEIDKVVRFTGIVLSAHVQFYGASPFPMEKSHPPFQGTTIIRSPVVTF
jgi:hypothetical protein